ncbi:MAG: NusG domain II-containing protein [Lachnospiraceae bacterium]|nr:NusG domain II-containing protein [Lachnospiraceae bacterium]
MNTPVYKRAALIFLLMATVMMAGAAGYLIRGSLSKNRDLASVRVLVYQSGRLLMEETLPRHGEPEKLFRIESASGGYNILSLTSEGAAVTEADCPNGTCVRMGRRKDASLPIACLPHDLLIVVEQTPETDAITY